MGAKALRNFGVNRSLYICPICRRIFEEGGSDSHELTLEHVPPKSAGGKEILLTCKQCNVGAGTKYDHQFLENQKYLDFVASTTTGAFIGGGDIELSHLENTANAKLIQENDQLTINLDYRHNSPQAAQYFHNLFQSEITVEIGFSYESRSRQDFLDVAYLKSAFLFMCAKFGYSFILSQECDVIRSQIIQHDAKIFELVAILETKPLEDGIYLDELHSIAIVVFLGRCVAMPWLGWHRPVESSDLRSLLTGEGNLTKYTLPTKFEAIFDPIFAAANPALRLMMTPTKP